MSIRLQIKGLILAVCFFAYVFQARAQEKISFVWQVNAFDIYKDFRIATVKDSLFTVDWGDDCIDTIKGSESYSNVNHAYKSKINYKVTITGISAVHIVTHFNCSNRQLIALNLSECTALKELQCYNNLIVGLDLRGGTILEKLYCNNNQLTILDISTNTALNVIHCYNNQLQLSDLFKISEKISNPSSKRLGTQTLNSRTLSIDGSMNFSAQKEFGGIATIFTIEKNSIPASPSDYTINDGIIKFNERGIYTVTMTNNAITSSESYPAKVVAEFNVGNVDITESAQETSNIKVYPNPTYGQLTMNNEQLIINDVEIYDVVGQKLQSTIVNLQSEITIDISHLPAGVYFLKAGNKVAKVVKR